MSILKIFKATIVAQNPCYIETVLVIDKDKEKAHKNLCKKLKREVSYKEELKELSIDLTKPNVILDVGFRENESSSRHSLDD